MNRTIRNVILLSILFIYTLFYRYFIMDHLLKFGESISASFMILFLALAILLLGFKRNKSNMLKKNIVLLTFAQIFVFFILSYLLGLVVGFLKNAYSLELPTMFNNIFAPIIIIICTELFRYVFISANKDSKETMIIGTALLFLFEVFITIKKINFGDIPGVFEITTSSILPILFKNLVLSYLTYHVGYKPSLIYRLIMDVYIFVLPIVPDLGDYLNSMVGICMPILLFIFSSRIIESYYNLEERKYYKSGLEWVDLPIILFIVVLVALISGYFPYYLIGIGSNSMKPKINKGDAVLVHKVDDIKDLELGDIIVYQHDGRRIVHRLVDIELKNNKTYYYTKGDANNSRDDVELEFDDILGVVNFKIPYLSYPSVWLTESLEK